MFGYYVQQPSLWYDVNRTLVCQINYCIYLYLHLSIISLDEPVLDRQDSFIDELNSRQVKIKYEFSKPFHSESFSKDENHAELEQFLWPFNYLYYYYKTIIQ